MRSSCMARMPAHAPSCECPCAVLALLVLLMYHPPARVAHTPAARCLCIARARPRARSRERARAAHGARTSALISAAARAVRSAWPLLPSRPRRDLRAVWRGQGVAGSKRRLSRGLKPLRLRHWESCGNLPLRLKAVHDCRQAPCVHADRGHEGSLQTCATVIVRSGLEAGFDRLFGHIGRRNERNPTTPQGQRSVLNEG